VSLHSENNSWNIRDVAVPISSFHWTTWSFFFFAFSSQQKRTCRQTVSVRGRNNTPWNNFCAFPSYHLHSHGINITVDRDRLNEIRRELI